MIECSTEYMTTKVVVRNMTLDTLRFFTRDACRLRLRVLTVKKATYDLLFVCKLIILNHSRPDLLSSGRA